MPGFAMPSAKSFESHFTETLIWVLIACDGRRRYFCYDVTHWLGAFLESALYLHVSAQLNGKHRLRLGYGCVITYHKKQWTWLIIHAIISVHCCRWSCQSAWLIACRYKLTIMSRTVFYVGYSYNVFMPRLCISQTLLACIIWLMRTISVHGYWCYAMECR